MASEVATAYVRIRPNTRNFKGEAESGLRKAFGELAKVAGVAFGVKEAFDFTKEIATHAADVQKQIEAVKNEFGSAAEEILKFGEEAGKSLGLSEHAVESTAARFGIIFRNLGIGQEEAATMTIGFEKLAGSLALIRNVDPSQILRNIPLAVQGNLRSLKQLGIATDQTQLKLAAYKLGLTKTVTEGLTPATRAQAIYAIATAHLNEFQLEAAKHAGDVATQMKILSAEWDNGKDKLGVELLPVINRLVTYLAANLPHAIDVTIAEFHKIRDTVGPIAAGFVELTKPIGGLKTALKAVLIGWLAWKAAMKLDALVVATARIATTTTAMFGLAGAEAAASKEALLLRNRLLALGAIGAIAVTVVVAEKIAKSVKSLQENQLSAQNATAPVSLQKSLVPHLAEQIEKLKKAGVSSKEILAKLRKELGGSLKADDLIAQAFDFSTSSKDAERIKQQWKDALAKPAKEGIKDARDAIDDQIRKISSGQEAAIAKARGDLKQLGTQLADAVKQETEDVRNAVESAKSNLNSIGQSLSDAIGQVLDKPLQNQQDAISRAQNRQSLENLRKSALLPGGKTLSTNPTVALQQLNRLASATNNVNRGAIQSFITQYRTALLSVRQDQVNVTKEAASRRISDLTDAFNRGQLSLAQYKKRVLAILTADHVSYRKAGALLGTAFANGFRDTVSGLFKQAGAIAATPAKFRAGISGADPQIVKPLETLRNDQQSIAKISHQIANKQVALQQRIAKASEKTAQLQAKLNALEINASRNEKNPGKQTKRANALSGAH